MTGRPARVRITTGRRTLLCAVIDGKDERGMRADDMEYNAIISFADTELDSDGADQVLEQLAAWGPAIGWTDDHPQVVVTLDADSMPDALQRALGPVEAAVGAHASAAEVIPTSAYDAR